MHTHTHAHTHTHTRTHTHNTVVLDNHILVMINFALCYVLADSCFHLCLKQVWFYIPMLHSSYQQKCKSQSGLLVTDTWLSHDCHMTVYRCTKPFQLPSHHEQSYSRRWKYTCKLRQVPIHSTFSCSQCHPLAQQCHPLDHQCHHTTQQCHHSCHSLYHHVTLQEVHNLLQPLRVHGPPNKGITVPLD